MFLFPVQFWAVFAFPFQLCENAFNSVLLVHFHRIIKGPIIPVHLCRFKSPSFSLPLDPSIEHLFVRNRKLKCFMHDQVWLAAPVPFVPRMRVYSLPLAANFRIVNQSEPFLSSQIIASSIAILRQRTEDGGKSITISLQWSTCLCMRPFYLFFVAESSFRLGSRRSGRNWSLFPMIKNKTKTLCFNHLSHRSPFFRRLCRSVICSPRWQLGIYGFCQKPVIRERRRAKNKLFLLQRLIRLLKAVSIL